MAGKAFNGVLQRIRTLAAVHTGRACGDRELLERFLIAEDEAAFTLLVDRHGPMILSLCRRLLRDRHEADDACQATFLVLARKARSLRKQESLASWLHGVAYRISASLRRQHARRLKREQAASRPAACQPDDAVSWREFHAVLDDELQRLPDRYRAPLILCYLEGKTRDEAAQQLGAKPGALHGLLDRGRKLLRERLVKRGVTLSATLFAAVLAESASKAALAPALVVSSARAALALLRGDTIGEGLIRSHILALAKEASTTMFMTKLKIGAALVAAASILTSVVGGSLSSVSLAQDGGGIHPKAAPAAAKNIESDEQFIRRISKDLRGTDPTPTEVHFFVNNKDANRRQKLIDLLIAERQATERAQAAQQVDRQVLARWINRDVHRQIASRNTASTALLWSALRNNASCTACHREPVHSIWVDLPATRLLSSLQRDLVKDVSIAAKDKKEVAAIAQKYLDQLQEYVKANPKHADTPEAMRQIDLMYRSQGKIVEADAWRDKLRKEHPDAPAAKGNEQSSLAAPQPYDWAISVSNLPANTPWINVYRALGEQLQCPAAIALPVDPKSNTEMPKGDDKAKKK